MQILYKIFKSFSKVILFFKYSPPLSTEILTTPLQVSKLLLSKLLVNSLS